MPIILSGPPISAPVPEAQWQTITVEWVGWDGSVWNLADGSEGVVLQADGTEGMHDPVVVKFKSSPRAIPGDRLRGSRVEAREVFWPLKVYRDGSEQWVDTYDRFFSSIDEERAGTWRVGFGGQVRELDLTGVYERGHAFGTHPTVFGWGTFAVTLEAVSPFWRGAPIVRGPWRAPSSVPFFGASGAPDFNIGEGSAFGSAVIDNPGDYPVFLTWEIVGPLSSVTVGVEGAVITVPFDVPDGQTLRIDTDVRNPVAVMGPTGGDGVDVTEALGLQPFVPVGRGERQALIAQGTGTGSITAQLTPLYKRAIGRAL